MSEKKNPIEIVVKMPVGTTGGFFQFEPIRDEAGLVNLTDLWRRFGAIDNKNPYEWSRKEGRNFLEAICRELNAPRSRIYRSQRGRGGSSLAHWQVAMTYLTYLSPEAQMLVNRIVKERIEEEANPNWASGVPSSGTPGGSRPPDARTRTSRSGSRRWPGGMP
jgi:hypothetical protein